jgi:hypothetical protein
MTVERSRSRERRTGVIDAARRWKAGAGAGHTLATNIKSARVGREKIGYRACVKCQAPKASILTLQKACSYVSGRQILKIAALRHWL